MYGLPVALFEHFNEKHDLIFDDLDMNTRSFGIWWPPPSFCLVLEVESARHSHCLGTPASDRFGRFRDQRCAALDGHRRLPVSTFGHRESGVGGFCLDPPKYLWAPEQIKLHFHKASLKENRSSFLLISFWWLTASCWIYIYWMICKPRMMSGHSG